MFTASIRALRKTVLVVIEEPAIRELVAANLRHAGFLPVSAASAHDGRRLLAEVRPDVILIDIDAPATADTRFVVAQGAADPACLIPTVMVTSNMEHVCGLDGRVCGATLCLAKPYSPRDLVSRIARQLRPEPSQSPGAPRARRVRGALQVGPILLDAARLCATVRRDGRTQSIDLAPIEAKLLACLMQEPGRALCREHIVAAVWGDDCEIEPRTVDQYIKRLRRCLEEVAAGDLLKTVRGLGYRLDSTPSRAAPRGR